MLEVGTRDLIETFIREYTFNIPILCERESQESNRLGEVHQNKRELAPETFILSIWWLKLHLAKSYEK